MIFCAGAGNFFNLICASEFRVQHYIYVLLSRVDSHDHKKDSYLEQRAIEIMAEQALVTVNFLGPFEFSSNVDEFRYGDFPVCLICQPGDVITANLFEFFGEDVVGRQVNIFFDGATHFSFLLKELCGRWVKRLVEDCFYRCDENKKLGGIHALHYASAFWMLPDPFRVAVLLSFFFPRLRCLDGCQFEERAMCLARRIYDQVPQLQINEPGSVWIHPLLDQLDDSSYERVINSIRVVLADEQPIIMLKRRARDNRRYGFFADSGFYEFDEFARYFPAEIFLWNNFNYVGNFSAILSFFPKTTRYILIEFSEAACFKAYKRSGKAMKFFLKIQLRLLGNRFVKVK